MRERHREVYAPRLALRERLQLAVELQLEESRQAVGIRVIPRREVARVMAEHAADSHPAGAPLVTLGHIAPVGADARSRLPRAEAKHLGTPGSGAEEVP